MNHQCFSLCWGCFDEKLSVSTLTLQGRMVVLLLESPDRLGQLCAPPAKSWKAWRGFPLLKCFLTLSLKLVRVCAGEGGGGALLNQFPELYFKTHNINLSFAHLCIWDAHGTLGLGTNIHIYIYFVLFLFFSLRLNREKLNLSSPFTARHHTSHCQWLAELL